MTDEQGYTMTERQEWEQDHRAEYRLAEHLGDQEALNRLDAEWSALSDDEQVEA